MTRTTEPVGSIEELQHALGKSPDKVLLLVKRNGECLFVVIQLK
jgi:hypothetical protein